MLDFSNIGCDAFVIQYEDLISLMGLNAVSYILSKRNNQSVSDDMILAYINRDIYDIPTFVKKHTSVDFNMENMYKSQIVCKPNLAYAFKMMQAAYQNGIKKLYVHSNEYSPIIEKFIQQLEIPTNYVHGDIIPVLHSLPNCTYTTSNPDNIKKCVDVDVPFALTIVDDFQYVGPIVVDESFIKTLTDKNIFIQYTGVISAGVL